MTKIADIDFVNLRDIASEADLTFSRDSVAYLPSTGAQVESGAARIEPVTVATPVEVSTIADKWVCGTDDAYLYSADNRILYKSRDGQDWSLMHNFGSTIRSMHVTAQKTLLVGTEDGKMWRYDGSSWANVTTTTVGVFGDFSWSEAAGHIFVSEYRTAFDTNNARRTRLSKDDGLTWEVIYTPDNVAGSPGQHSHTPCACVVNGEVICYQSYGDGANAMIRKLTFNGTTWDAEVIEDKIKDQPCSAVWIPERNVILWGSDGSPRSSSIVEHDLSTDLASIVFYGGRQNFDPLQYVDKMVNFFYAKKVGGLYVFCGVDLLGTEKRGGLWLSNDGVNFVPIVQDLSDPRRIVQYKGKMYWGDYNNKCSYYCDMPNCYRSKGCLIERNSDNLIGLDDEVFAPMTGYTTTFINDLAEGRQNVRLKLSGDSSITKYLQYGTVQSIQHLTGNMDAGEWYYFSVWVKGRFLTPENVEGFTIKASVYDNVIDGGSGGYTDQNQYRNITNDDIWKRYIVAVKTAYDLSATRGRHNISWTHNGTFEIWLDDWNCEAGKLCPAHFQPRDTVRPQEVLSYTKAYGSTFTDVLTFAPTFDSNFCFGKAVGDYVYIKTYIEDASNYMAVVLDTYDKKIKLIDQTGVIANSSTLEWYENQAMTVAVTRDGTSSALHVWTPNGYETDSGTVAELTFASVNYGSDAAGANGGSFIFVRNVTYDSVLSDVKDYMQWPKQVRVKETETFQKPIRLIRGRYGYLEQF